MVYVHNNILLVLSINVSQLKTTNIIMWKYMLKHYLKDSINNQLIHLNVVYNNKVCTFKRKKIKKQV